ncbi:MAG TPA: SDR family NAD(P)-dependent oxidoreductase, partial [Baekduia sp.]|nr:SDR family NAD(P)-dependent oxidoreductase [Baekduia sp.]
DVIKLAARGGAFDLVEEFGVDRDLLAAFGRDTQLALAAGIDALRDAGIPLVQRYRTTTVGSQLPDGWALPDALRDDTGVIFASAFPGLEEFAAELDAFWADRSRREQIAALEGLLARAGDDVLRAEIERRIHELRLDLEGSAYRFDRRFLFRMLSMGHSQFAQHVGARGPNTQLNAACASTTQAVAVAEDWIRAGRCSRVVVIAADDATSDEMLPWIGAGFLASGAAATDEAVEDAALPFDQRRHGMLLGMGAAALVVESAQAARERGITPICEVLGSVTANSAFHGTRLDVDHIGGVMEDVVRRAEAQGLRRAEMAAETVFISHETYTPARGGSAAAEIHALRRVFGEAAGEVVIANTKGFTGHPMGVGLEDVVAVKALETGLVPPVPNFREVDPELGSLNLSKGGVYPVRYALRLAAGFGSQIAMLLLRWTPAPDGRRRHPEELGFAYRVADEQVWQRWLASVSGQDAPELEVVQHRLRVKDRGPAAAPQRTPAPDPPEQALAPPRAEEAVQVAEEPRAAAAAAPAGDDVLPTILEIVATQTGYPTDLLDPELDLEADLGIDTVRQAEVFAAIREHYAIQRDDTLKLRDYPTLTHVVGFVEDRRPESTATAPRAPEPQAAPAAEPAGDDVLPTILEIVAAQTGYPTDLLDPELDLEADLGIDTVKQAEVFAAIREHYAIQRDDTLKLRDYPTLTHVVGFVEDRRPHTTATTPPAPPAPAPQATVAGMPEGVDRDWPRRIPVPIVRPALEQCVATGVTLGQGSRVLVVADAGGVGAALAAALTARGAEVHTVADAPAAEELEQRLATVGGVDGVFWLPALDDEGPLDRLDPAGWKEALRVRVKLLAVTMRALPDAFLVSATRLGGKHGYDAGGATSVLGGAVTGFTKALAREREATLVKAVDLPSATDPAATAELLLAEAQRDPGAVEVGHADDLRWSVGLVERPAAHDMTHGLRAGATFVVTGAAGSIVSAITADLAQATAGTFHLLDLTPAPDRADPDLGRFATDKDGLKRELAGRLRAAGEKPTPKLVERELSRIERARAALDAIEAIEGAGGTAHWHQVDLTDAGAVQRALHGIDDVDVLLHCAGLEISHVLADKPQREYDLVFDVKADGWFHLLHALRGGRVGTVVAFSSIAGRFGNAGQTDYAAANDLLCKAISHLRRSEDTRGIAIDWTAWAGIGMATRGSIPKMMELAGIDMLPPEIGVPAVRREITARGAGGEVVIAGRLGILLEERHPTGGLDAEAATAAVGAPHGPMLGRVVRMTAREGVVVQTEIDPGRQAFLHDHRIEGTPVLPGVMGMEGFAEVAHAMVPGWAVGAVEDIELLAPVKFYRDEPRVLELRALLRDAGDGTLVADCRLLGRRTLPGQGETETVHFTGRAVLTRQAPAPPTVQAPGNGGTTVGHDDVYRVFFHGPAYQVLDRAWRSNGHVVGELAPDLPPQHEPPGMPTELVPRLIELCFQTAGILEIGTTGRMALPTHVDRVVRFAGADDPGRLFAVVEPRADGTGADALVVDETGRARIRLEGYRTIELPGGLDADALAPLRTAMKGA